MEAAQRVKNHEGRLKLKDQLAKTMEALRIVELDPLAKEKIEAPSSRRKPKVGGDHRDPPVKVRGSAFLFNEQHPSLNAYLATP
jgi:hypothetical protein